MRYFILLLFLVSILSCQLAKYPNFSQITTSNQGIVSSAQPLATLAGKEMLARGGNAVDAAVATGFALAVVEPSMSGLGGRLQAIVRLPNGELRGFDATTQAPMRYDTATTPDVRYGYDVIGIPGVPAGLVKMQKEFGKLPLATVMQPAIRYAKKGFKLLPGEAIRQQKEVEKLSEFAGSTQYFLKEGEARTPQDKFVQSDLAKVLERIAAQGHKGFYQGETAQKMVADVQANGGILTLEDLANYRVEESQILSGSYRGHDIHALWMPSFGAITIEILHILEQLPMQDLQNADWASAVAQAIELAYQDRKKQLVSNTDSIINVLTDKDYAKTLAAKIDVKGNTKMGFVPPQTPESWQAEMGHTTHLSTIDKDDMMVALTQTIGPNMGSRVASPDLGFLYAVTLGRYLGVYDAGQRAASHVSPVILTKNGQPYMALGAAGGNKIPPAIIATISRIVDHKMTLKDALNAPRAYHDEKKMWLETHAGTTWKKEYTEQLEEAGFPIKTIDQRGRFGRVHAVLYDAARDIWVGGADPDWEGVAAGAEE